MYTEEFMNNFHCYFPGGAYRRIKINQKNKGIISILDRLLEESSFKFEEFDIEQRLWFEKVRKVSEMVKKGKPKREIEIIGKESEKHCQRVQEIIRLLYNKMRCMGFSQSELTK